MSNFYKILIMAILCKLSVSCTDKQNYDMGTYGYDSKFLRENNIDFLELAAKDGKSKIIVVPAYQARVMTSTSNGDMGDSYGWINYSLIKSGKIDKQFNPVGGEERFWLGPEGGPFSLYFKEGAEQIYENWIVPNVIDTETYNLTSQGDDFVTFGKKADLTNASGTVFNVDIERKISLLDVDAVKNKLSINISQDLNIVAYQTDNKITNIGKEAWSKEKGLVSIWLLCMFAPTPTTTVFIPYNTDSKTKVVNDEYFGKVPSDRLIDDNNGMLFFKIDGKYRSKIGVPAGRAKELCGSYDTEKQVLTLLCCSIPQNEPYYLNGQWGAQEDSYAGDVINTYNDGPVEDGSVMGPFYEIETSSPGAELEVNESIVHSQMIVHIQGDSTKICEIIRVLFGMDLNTITKQFK